MSSSRKRKIVAKPVLRVEVLDNNGEIETNFNIDLMQNMTNINPAAMIGDSISAITDVRDASEVEAVLDENEHCCNGSSSCICFL